MVPTTSVVRAGRKKYTVVLTWIKILVDGQSSRSMLADDDDLDHKGYCVSKTTGPSHEEKQYPYLLNSRTLYTTEDAV